QEDDDEEEEEDGGDPSNGRRSSSVFVTGRWRWGPGSSSQMLARGMGPGLAILPEMDPPPMYQNEPGLPTYNPDDINMTRIQGGQEGASNAAGPTQSLEDTGHERIADHLEGTSSTVVIPIDGQATNDRSTSTPTMAARITPSTHILPEETHLPTMPSLQPIHTHNNNDNQTHILEPEAAHLSPKDK
ncbi:hypothetical protein BGZ81_001955, partial [Podila clonocystis]